MGGGDSFQEFSLLHGNQIWALEGEGFHCTKCWGGSNTSTVSGSGSSTGCSPVSKSVLAGLLEDHASQRPAARQGHVTSAGLWSMSCGDMFHLLAVMVTLNLSSHPLFKSNMESCAFWLDQGVSRVTQGMAGWLSALTEDFAQKTNPFLLF